MAMIIDSTIMVAMIIYGLLLLLLSLQLRPAIFWPIEIQLYQRKFTIDRVVLIHYWYVVCSCSIAYYIYSIVYVKPCHSLHSISFLFLTRCVISIHLTFDFYSISIMHLYKRTNATEREHMNMGKNVAP